MNASPVMSISRHAVERFSQRIDSRLGRGHARVALYRMFKCSYEANDHLIRRLRLKPDGETRYYISESTYGRYVIVLKRGVLVTLWEDEG